MGRLSFISAIFTLCIAALAVTGCNSDTHADGFENLSIEQAHQDWSLKEKATTPFVFLDVRTRMEFEDGHVPGAINIPIQTLANRLDEVPRDKRLYVYCESGVRSTNASKYLVEAGFTQIKNVKASMRGWRNAQYPIEK